MCIADHKWLVLRSIMTSGSMFLPTAVGGIKWYTFQLAFCENTRLGGLVFDFFFEPGRCPLSVLFDLPPMAATKEKGVVRGMQAPRLARPEPLQRALPSALPKRVGRENDARTIYNFHKALLRHRQRRRIFERPRCPRWILTDL